MFFNIFADFCYRARRNAAYDYDVKTHTPGPGIMILLPLTVDTVGRIPGNMAVVSMSRAGGEGEEQAHARSSEECVTHAQLELKRGDEGGQRTKFKYIESKT